MVRNIRAVRRVVTSGVLALAIGTGTTACSHGLFPSRAAPTASPQSSCPVSPPAPVGPNGALGAGGMSGAWYVSPDGQLGGVKGRDWQVGPAGNKVPWLRPIGAPLRISGHPLDAPTPTLVASIPGGYPTAFQATGLTFPTAGCWEITAVAGSSVVQFVVWVVPPQPPITEHAVFGRR